LRQAQKEYPEVALSSTNIDAQMMWLAYRICGYNSRSTVAMSKPALNDVRLLIFDLDGTLIDSKTDLVLSVNAMREQMGLARLDTTVIVSYVGRGIATLIRRALSEGASDDEVTRASTMFLDYYGRHLLDNTVPYPGVRQALEDLRGRKMAVLTNKRVDFSREILDGLGLAHHFLWIYGDTSFRQKKPDPVGIFTLMSETQIPACRTLMVGDSDTDVLTGRNAGVWTCGVTYGFGAHTLETVPPDVILNDLRDLPGLLNRDQEPGSGDQGPAIGV
jgi:phosphoglycolate phosphatase